MWVTRNKDGELILWWKKPKRYKRKCKWGRYGITNIFAFSIYGAAINSKLFPELKWEDEPVEVAIVSKKLLSDMVNYIKNVQTHMTEMKEILTKK